MQKLADVVTDNKIHWQNMPPMDNDTFDIVISLRTMIHCWMRQIL